MHLNQAYSKFCRDELPAQLQKSIIQLEEKRHFSKESRVLSKLSSITATLNAVCSQLFSHWTLEDVAHGLSEQNSNECGQNGQLNSALRISAQIDHYLELHIDLCRTFTTVLD